MAILTALLVNWLLVNWQSCKACAEWLSHTRDSATGLRSKWQSRNLIMRSCVQAECQLPHAFDQGMLCRFWIAWIQRLSKLPVANCHCPQLTLHYTLLVWHYLMVHKTKSQPLPFKWAQAAVLPLLTQLHLPGCAGKMVQKVNPYSRLAWTS